MRNGFVGIALVNTLVLVFTQFEGDDRWGNALPGIIANAAILRHARTPLVRRAFDQ